MYDEFQAEIKRLTEEVEYYQDRYDMVCQINNQQMETISTYAQIVKLQEVEIAKLSRADAVKAFKEEDLFQYCNPNSADAVQGEWVDVENEPYCECSVCGSYIDNLDDDYAFCPRCGARMKGGNSE